MSKINWKRVRSQDDVPKDRRVLLIGELTDRIYDAADSGIIEVVVGHWDRHQAAFVPVDVPGQGGARPHLRVLHWADLDLPGQTKLRNIDSFLDL